jgi:hypothetical protein
MTVRLPRLGAALGGLPTPRSVRNPRKLVVASYDAFEFFGKRKRSPIKHWFSSQAPEKSCRHLQITEMPFLSFQAGPSGWFTHRQQQLQHLATNSERSAPQ